MRKAEEEEKLARAKRQEARAKKEEAEREKREQAREQRRLEREARELKIQNRNEPKEIARSVYRFLCTLSLRSYTVSSARSSQSSTPAGVAHPKGPSINGVVIPTPLQMTRNSTSNGVRSPDWILDCEICGTNGLNLVRCLLYRVSLVH